LITEVQEPVAPVFVQPPRPITNYPETQRQPTIPQNYTRNNLPETQRQPTDPINRGVMSEKHQYLQKYHVSKYTV
jgi:hypothetical protein